MIAIILNYVYLSLFIGTIVAGDTVAILGGFLAYQGYIPLVAVVVLVSAGSFVSDLLFYLLGSYYGRDFIDQRPMIKVKAWRVDIWLMNHRVKVILGYRFLYGLRIASLLVIGASKIKFKEFVWLNLIGSLLWALVVTTVGYLFGNALSFIINDIDQYELEVISVGLIFIMVGWIIVANRICRDHFRSKSNLK